MKKSVFAAGLVLVAGAAQADAISARHKFVEAHAKVFARTVAGHAEFTPRELRYDLPEGKGTYWFVMGNGKDDRLQFARIESEGGKVVKGEHYLFGLEPKPLDDRSFAELRAKRAMFGTKVPTDSYSPPATFYPATDAPAEVREEGQGLGMSYHLMGDLVGIARTVGVSLSKLYVNAFYRCEDSSVIDLGVRNATAYLGEGELAKRLRAELERRTPARKGMFSDRDLADFVGTCWKTFKPVSPEVAKETLREQKLRAEKARAAALAAEIAAEERKAAEQ